MSMKRFIRRVTSYDYAVYWPPINVTDYGQYTFAEAVEIKCRWDDVEVRFTNADGSISTGTAKIWTTYPMKPRGILWHGRLTDVSDLVIPRNNSGFIEIKYFSSTPDLKNKTKLVIVKG